MRTITCLFLLFAVCLFVLACNSTFTPKRRGYFKIDLPQRAYQLYNQPGVPYTFEYPVYSNIVRDTTFFEEQTENPYWINIVFPQFESKIYLSYKEIGTVYNFDKLVADAYQMAHKQHTLKANAIEDSLMKTPLGLSGIYYQLQGNTATANQFYITDSVKHFLRGALYFDATPNEDSLRVVNDFLKEDMKHLINTLRWK
jgi:gliding motility-associated lipoprotein GldD